MKLSEEQQSILTAFSTHNVIVNSVAGSGKTTSIIGVLEHFTNKTFLVLTYNSRLKTETRDRCKHLKNVTVHNYHSFGLQYYGSAPHDLLSAVDQATSLKQTYNFDAVILDEAQDITPVFFSLILRIARDNERGIPSWLLLGDCLQSIYQFHQADPRYLTMADKCLPSTREWIRCNLTTSYRCTKPMCEFVNLCLHRNWMSSSIPGPPVTYVYGDLFKEGARILAELLTVYSPDDIFVLSPSLEKSNKQAVVITENLLKKYAPDIPVAILREGVKDEKTLKGKIIFSTIHKVKGLERPVVVLFGFDSSYYASRTTEDPSTLSHALYVGITRANRKLIVLHHRDFTPIEPLVPLEDLEDLGKETCVELEKREESKDKRASTRSTPKGEIDKIDVTFLLSHLRTEVIQHAKTFLQISQKQSSGEIISCPHSVYVDGLKEDVHSMVTTGIMLTYCKEVHNNYLMPSQADIYSRFGAVGGDTMLAPPPAWLSPEKARVWQYLRWGSLKHACVSGFVSQAYQVHDFTFMSPDVFDSAVARICESVEIDDPDLVKVVVPLTSIHHSVAKGYKEALPCALLSTVDVLTVKEVWRIVNRTTPSDTDLIAVACQMYLANVQSTKEDRSTPEKVGCLLDIRTGEVWCVQASLEDLADMILYLYEAKTTHIVIPDDQFCKMIEEAKAKWKNYTRKVESKQCFFKKAK